MNDEKQELIDNINKAAPVIQKMRPLEAEKEELEGKIAKISAKGSGNGCLLYGAISVFSLFFFIFLAVMGVLFIISSPEYFMGGLFFMLPLVLYIGDRIKKDASIKAAQARIAKIDTELEALSHDASIAWLPYRYCTSACFDTIASYVANGRVDSFKEAVNLLEQEINMANMKQEMKVAAYLGARSGKL